jgi:TonB family protein
MQSRTTNRIKHFGMIAAIALSIAACNGSDSSDKTSAEADSSAKVAKADSTAKVASTRKRKGKTSFTMPVAGNDKIVRDSHGVYNRAETMPEFPGGQEALADYINKNLVYDQSAIDNNTDGTVHVSFIVDEKGKVTDPQLMDAKKLGNGLDESALKVFNNMPAWTPGKVKGKKVKTRLQVPITFQLES